MSTDKDTLRRVYEDEMNHLAPLLRSALDSRTETDLNLIEAQRRHINAVTRHATLQGRVDALRETAARDGITLP